MHCQDAGCQAYRRTWPTLPQQRKGVLTKISLLLFQLHAVVMGIVCNSLALPCRKEAELAAAMEKRRVSLIHLVYFHLMFCGDDGVLYDAVCPYSVPPRLPPNVHKWYFLVCTIKLQSI